MKLVAPAAALSFVINNANTVSKKANAIPASVNTLVVHILLPVLSINL